MLRNVNTFFEKKKKSLTGQQDKALKIKDGLKIFLRNNFGENLNGFSFVVSYNIKEDSLVIKTDQKTIANELTLKLTELSDFLKARGIRLKRILIR